MQTLINMLHSEEFLSTIWKEEPVLLMRACVPLTYSSLAFHNPPQEAPNLCITQQQRLNLKQHKPTISSQPVSKKKVDPWSKNEAKSAHYLPTTPWKKLTLVTNTSGTMNSKLHVNLLITSKYKQPEAFSLRQNTTPHKNQLILRQRKRTQSVFRKPAFDTGVEAKSASTRTIFAAKKLDNSAAAFRTLPFLMTTSQSILETHHSTVTRCLCKA